MAAAKKKSEFVERLIAEVEPLHPYPAQPLQGASLLEQGAVLVLMRRLTENQAEASVKALQAHFDDWNEIRVSQAQEIASCFRTSSRKKGPALLNDQRETALLLKAYLQDVFQQTHHLDLEELREDEATAGKVANSLTVLGMTGAAYLIWVAHDGAIPVHLPLARLLDKLGVIPRTQSLKKARESIEPLVPEGKELAFTIAIHEVLSRWDDPDAPIYETVPVIGTTAVGKKAHKDRENALARAEAQRLRDEERQRKEDERARKEAERERKKLEAEAGKRAREMERRRAKEQAIAKKKADVERKKVEIARNKKAEIVRKAAAKKAAAKKAAAKKTAAKKTAAKKTTAKKTTAKKTTGKKSASKKTSASRPAAKKTAGKAAGKTTRKAAKKPAVKKAAKKPAAKKAASRPAAKKKVVRRR